MALYGYKISNFTKAKKYAEIEALLDKKLKGFEKQSYEFEKDGSVCQDYVRKNEDGTETTVTLAKNITESSIVVFSDIPLKFLRNGGWRYPANAYIYGAVLVRHELYRAAYCMGADRAVYIVPAYCSCDNAGGRSYCRKAAYAQAFTGKDPLDRNGGHILAAYIFLDTFQGVCSCFIDADA